MVNNLEITTRSGKPIFPIGIGTWGISSAFDKTVANYELLPYNGTKAVYGNEDNEIDAIRYSFDRGQNHIDCAQMYGAFYTDEVIGQAIQGYNRQELFIADKLWKTSLAKGKVRPTVEEMLKKLQTDYIDLLYIHNNWQDIAWDQAIEQIDQLIDEGVVRYFGVSNFPIEDMKKALSLCSHGIAANQMNYNVLYKDEVNEAFIKFCIDNEIIIVAYQPIKRKEVIGHKVLVDVARKYGASETQIAIAWLIKHNSLPIPKATTKDHIDQNIRSISIEISPEDMRILDSI